MMTYALWNSIDGRKIAHRELNLLWSQIVPPFATTVKWKAKTGVTSRRCKRKAQRGIALRTTDLSLKWQSTVREARRKRSDFCSDLILARSGSIFPFSDILAFFSYYWLEFSI